MSPRTDFSHFGMCVSDLERSTRFYVEALGFTPAEMHSVGPEFDRLMELEDVSLRSQFLRRGDLAIELLSFASPKSVGSRDRQPMNQIGLTHISIRVDDVDEVASRVSDLGGSVVTDTRTTMGSGDTKLDFVYCTDPDGVRIELMNLGD